jgi:hypothetical protein
LRRGRGQDVANGLLESGARLFADEVGDNSAIAAIENGFGHGAGPGRIYALIKCVDVNAGLLAVTREAGAMQFEKMADEMHVGIIIEADAESGEALGRVLLGEADEHGKFVAAGFAPGGPKSDEERFAFVLRDDAMVAIEIDQRERGLNGRLRRVRGGLGGCRMRPGDASGDDSEKRKNQGGLQ